MGKVAFITGITGQTGSYLAEFLLERDYEVHGLIRTSNHMENISHISDLIDFHFGDITDYSRLADIIKEVKPKEVYNLCAQSHVGKSFSCPLHTVEVNGLGAHKLMDVFFKEFPKNRFYQASTSEMFGDVITEEQNESTRFNPVSPYAISKLYAHNIAVNYRKQGYFASCGILFNHESPRRGEDFVTRKIVKGVAAILKGDQEVLKLGNLDALRDWGYAPDFCSGIWNMVQYKNPEDFILATGECHTVREFCEIAFNRSGQKIKWWGRKGEEKGVLNSGKVVVEIDPKFYRPNEIGRLCGDFKKAKKLLGWKPRVRFEDLVKLMVGAELDAMGIAK